MSAPPDGLPRFVAAFHHPEGGWRVAAEATAQRPVKIAVAEMIRTVQARGHAPVVEIWGPAAGGSKWELLERLAPGPGATPTAAPTGPRQRSAREERLLDRRNQVLTTALADAGVSITLREDDAAVASMIEAMDEDTIRRVAQWLSQANRL
jgi:hypothetical protein